MSSWMPVGLTFGNIVDVYIQPQVVSLHVNWLSNYITCLQRIRPNESKGKAREESMLPKQRRCRT